MPTPLLFNSPSTAKDSLIQEYPNALAPEICQFIIDKFESSQSLIEGMTAGGYWNLPFKNWSSLLPDSTSLVELKAPP